MSAGSGLQIRNLRVKMHLYTNFEDRLLVKKNYIEIFFEIIVYVYLKKHVNFLNNPCKMYTNVVTIIPENISHKYLELLRKLSFQNNVKVIKIRQKWQEKI